jgi:hypothetical protein|tara:strand:+ start:7126 stop:7377 length:252 start_codon:yes stop_codon:yes gene_type:complete
MTRTDLNNWLLDFNEINGIYIFSGSEGLWFLICLISIIWFILAIYRVEKNEHISIEEELSDLEDLKALIIEIHSEEADKNSPT